MCWPAGYNTLSSSAPTPPSPVRLTWTAFILENLMVSHGSTKTRRIQKNGISNRLYSGWGGVGWNHHLSQAALARRLSPTHTPSETNIPRPRPTDPFPDRATPTVPARERALTPCAATMPGSWTTTLARPGFGRAGSESSPPVQQQRTPYSACASGRARAGGGGLSQGQAMLHGCCAVYSCCTSRRQMNEVGCALNTYGAGRDRGGKNELSPLSG